MNAAATLSATACALELIVGLLCLGFARAPGWGHLRRFAFLAVTAAIYSASNLPQVAGVPDWAVVAAGQVSLLSLALHLGGWIVYSAPCPDGRPALGRPDLALLGLLGLTALLAAWPGVLASGAVVVHEVRWLGVRYATAVATPLGEALFPAYLVAATRPAWRYWRGVRRGEPGAAPHAVGFAVFFATGLNEALVAAHLIDGPYLLDLGLLAGVLAITVELVRRAVEGKRSLEALAGRLEGLVSERTRALGEAQAALARSERLAAVGLLASGVAHEVNNPLACVLANAGFAGEELRRLAPGQDGAEVAGALDELRHAAERIRGIMGDLRVFASDARPPQRDPTDARQVLESALTLVRHRLEGHAGVRREFAEVPPVAADAARLAQVFAALLDNAARAVPPGRPDLHEIRVRVRPGEQADEVLVEVEDTGEGIPPEHLPRLFEPFFTTRAEGGGRGMGLAICHGLVRTMGGRIEVASRVGEGTRVRVTLPAAGGRAAHA